MTTREGINPRKLARILGTVISLGLLIFLLSRQGWSEIWSAITSISLENLLLAGLLVLISRMAVVGRWASLLSSANIGVSKVKALKLTFAGLFAANFLPTTIGGDVIRIAEVANLKEKRAHYTASVLMDRAVGLLGMATVLPFGLLRMINQLDLLSPGNILAPIFLLGSVKEKKNRLTDLFDKYLLNPLAAFLEALRIWLRNPLGLVFSVGFTWVHMVCRFGALWLILRDQGETIGLLEVASLWSVVYFITLIPISLNGLGLQEISTTFMYTQVGGVAASSALTVAILIRTIEMAASLPGALFLPDLIRKSKSN